jgi:beta-aspartyl-peptidase (threonine type)
MEKSPHVLLIADGAEEFAIQQGLEQVTPNEWFYNMRNSSVTHPTMWNLNYRDPEPRGEVRPGPEEKYGTVGAVALDSNGHLAAATSTGGTSKKLKGRVGDSPIIGSGTWADSNCAVSCTGKGEIFIRQAVAHDLAARIKYARQTLEYASKEIIQEKLPLMVGGEGGLISVDKDGNLSLEFNTTVMFRGSIDSNGNKYIAVGR